MEGKCVFSHPCLVCLCLSKLGSWFKTQPLQTFYLCMQWMALGGKLVHVWAAHTHLLSLLLSLPLCMRKEAVSRRRTEWEKEMWDMEVLLVLRLCCNCTYGNDSVIMSFCCLTRCVLSSYFNNNVVDSTVFAVKLRQLLCFVDFRFQQMWFDFFWICMVSLPM